MTYTSHEPTKHAHMDEYMYKNENKQSPYQPLTQLELSQIILIAFSLVLLRMIRMKTKIHGVTDCCPTLKTLYKTKKKQQIFSGFRIQELKTEQPAKMHFFVGLNMPKSENSKLMKVAYTLRNMHTKFQVIPIFL